MHKIHLMNTSIDIHKLTPEERLELIDLLWASLRDDQREFQITDEQKQVLDSRVAQLDSGEAEFVSWEEAKSRILNKYKRKAQDCC